MGGSQVLGNFTSKAIEDLEALIHSHVLSQEDTKGATDTLTLLRLAQPFILPEGGLLFEFDMVKYTPEIWRLPYPVVSYEYSVAQQSGRPLKCLVVAFATAFDASNKIIKGKNKNNEASPGFAYVVLGFAGDRWEPLATGSSVLKGDGWQEESSVSLAAKKLYAGVPWMLQGRPFAEETLKSQEWPESEVQNAYDNCDCLLWNAHMVNMQVLKALECKNVGIQDIKQSPALQASRLRKGKAPLLDYKVLTLSAEPQAAKGSRASGGDRSPVRTHLRRGHIRHLPTHNIWVNSCVVRGGAPGVIVKDYAMEAA